MSPDPCGLGARLNQILVVWETENFIKEGISAGADLGFIKGGGGGGLTQGTNLLGRGVQSTLPSM